MLGMTKHMRSGRVTMGDCEGQSLEIVRQVKTGLFMVRIDHLDPQQYLALDSTALSGLVSRATIQIDSDSF